MRVFVYDVVDDEEEEEEEDDEEDEDEEEEVEDEEAEDEEDEEEVVVVVVQPPVYSHACKPVSMVYESVNVVEHLKVPVGSVERVPQAARAEET